jgi:hypothetical protein
MERLPWIVMRPAVMHNGLRDRGAGEAGIALQQGRQSVKR